jgi:hypothetical protein
MSAAVFGRPCPRRWLLSYFSATRSRYQRRIVSRQSPSFGVGQHYSLGPQLLPEKVILCLRVLGRDHCPLGKRWSIIPCFHQCRTRCLITPPRSPQANAICERLNGTLRRDCLDRLIVIEDVHADRGTLGRRSALLRRKGQMPDEMCFGHGEQIPVDLAAARAHPRSARMKYNRELSCEACRLPVQDTHQACFPLGIG